jgi:hypothetical protein
MQRTADFHDRISDPRLPEAADVVDNAAALDAAVDMLHACAPTGNAPIRSLLLTRERSAPRLLRRHDDLDLVEGERQEAEILEQPAPRGQGIRGLIGNPLIVGAAGIGRTEKENREGRVDQQHVFDRVALFLAAITARLLSRILGALDAPFGPIVSKRGEAGAGSPVGSTMAAAAASAIPRRLASSAKERVGASPSVRSVARRTTKRT